MSTSDAGDHAEPVAVASFATEGEAEVAQAKLRAYGIEGALDDQIEGGAVPIDGEPGVVVEVRAVDAPDALDILAVAAGSGAEDAASPASPESPES
ncbi:MAG: hypothetical protein ACR2HQ_08645 [Ilumatobacteraceae bacterium]